MNTIVRIIKSLFGVLVLGFLLSGCGVLALFPVDGGDDSSMTNDNMNDNTMDDDSMNDNTTDDDTTDDDTADDGTMDDDTTDDGTMDDDTTGDGMMDGELVGDAAAGEAFFGGDNADFVNCSLCHGADGDSGFAPALSGADSAMMFEELSAGSDHAGGTVAGITQQDADNIVAFLASL